MSTYYFSTFSLEKVYREMVTVVYLVDNRYYLLKDVFSKEALKESGDIEVYKLPSSLQSFIKKRIEKYSDNDYYGDDLI